MAGRLIRRAMAMRPATSMWTGSGMKQMARPTPKAVVTARLWRVQRRGSAMRSPNGRRYQRFCKAPGDGQIFFSRRRGMRLDPTLPEQFAKNLYPRRQGLFTASRLSRLTFLLIPVTGFLVRGARRPLGLVAAFRQ